MCVYVYVHFVYSMIECIRIRDNIYISMHVRIYKYMPMRVCMYTYVHTPLHLNTHTHTHTHTGHWSLVACPEGGR